MRNRIFRAPEAIRRAGFSASWMNMVEIWFSILTSQQVRRGVYHDVPELIAAIEHFIEGYNEHALPFVWTKTAEQVLEKAIEKQDTSETLHYSAYLRDPRAILR